MLIDQIKEGGHESESDVEVTTLKKKDKFDPLAAFNKGANVKKGNHEIDQEEIMIAAKEMFMKQKSKEQHQAEVKVEKSASNDGVEDDGGQPIKRSKY